MSFKKHTVHNTQFQGIVAATTARWKTASSAVPSAEAIRKNSVEILANCRECAECASTVGEVVARRESAVVDRRRLQW